LVLDLVLRELCTNRCDQLLLRFLSNLVTYLSHLARILVAQEGEDRRDYRHATG
jgi:hypothetical protein